MRVVCLAPGKEALDNYIGLHEAASICSQVQQNQDTLYQKSFHFCEKTRREQGRAQTDIKSLPNVRRPPHLRYRLDLFWNKRYFRVLEDLSEWLMST